jgi:hypothetical protein
VKGKIIIIIALFLETNVFAQELSHQVMLPAAGAIYTSAISYSQTVGETAVEIFTSSDHALTQGFQQPRITFIPGERPQGSGVKAFPNPATNFINIELFGESGKTFRINVSNISGTSVYTSEVSFSEKFWYIHEIPVSNFKTGLYFVQVISLDGAIRRSFKIEKL